MGVRKDFKKTLTCIIVLLLIPVVLYLFALFLPEYIPLFNDMYCMGKRPCDQADSIWQTDDGRLSIYGTNDGFSSTGIVKTEESEIKLVLFFDYTGGAYVFEYKFGFDRDDYFKEINSDTKAEIEFWLCTFKASGKEFKFCRSLINPQFSELDTLFIESNTLKVKRIN